MKKIVTYILLFCVGTLMGQETGLFKQANSLYNQKEYAKAIELYQQILNNGKHSVAVYYNKANAHYKLNQLGPSIYNYEKALQLDPTNEDVLTNRAFAANMLIDKIDVIPTSSFSKFFTSFLTVFSVDTWAVLAIIMVFVFVFAFVKYYLSYATPVKRLFFASALVAFIIASLFFSFAVRLEHKNKTENYAIVMAQKSQVKTDPNLAAEPAFELHEGTKVKVLESFEDWTKIRLTNGSVGWLLAKDVKML